MFKFIIIAFGFMAFAFYELSGGADFDGEALRLSRVEAGPAQQGLPKVVVASSESTQADDMIEVTRASFNLVEGGKLETDVPLTAEPSNATVDIIQTALVVEQEEPPVSQIILPSLIAPSVEAIASQEDLTAPVVGQDIRSVANNLVNVRGGPGTNFDIVGKLTRGAEVEILADNGDGWVEMRSIDGATIGWMADFLLKNG